MSILNDLAHTVENKETFRRYFAAMQAGDEVALRQMCDGAVSLWLPPSTAPLFARPVRGVDAVVALVLSADEYYLPGTMQWEHLAVIAEGSCVAGNEILRATRVDGERYENVYSHWFRFEGAKVVEIWEHVDTGRGLNPRRTSLRNESTLPEPSSERS